MAKREAGYDIRDRADMKEVQGALLDFIADFSDWNNATNPAYVQIANELTRMATLALGNTIGERPVVLDPFAGGGSIPLEALRCGADTFASDYNPVAVLQNKVLLEYAPSFGSELATAFREAGKLVEEKASDAIDDLFPSTHLRGEPVAYLWARAVSCDGPGCGARLPLMRSLWLSKKTRNGIALSVTPSPDRRKVDISIVYDPETSEVGNGTVKRGSATCPCCGFTTPVQSVRSQLCQQHGGADTSMLICVVSRDSEGKHYTMPTDHDTVAVEATIAHANREHILPAAPLPLMSGVFNVPIYGIDRWDLLFSARQLRCADVIGRAIASVCDEIDIKKELALPLRVLLLLARGKYLDFRSTLCGWISVGEKIGHTFGRQALGMIFDWTEGTPFGDISGSWGRSVDYIGKLLEQESGLPSCHGTAVRADAQKHPLPDDSVNAVITDPPYYNAVPYADLSDFFYIWLQRDLRNDLPDLFGTDITEKGRELVEMAGWDPVRYAQKNAGYFESGMQQALDEARRVCAYDGIAVIVFAHKTTAGWETMLSALINAGWIVTASWPIDTERAGRLRAMNSAALASSVHLVCRPREDESGALIDEVGEWREVLEELPIRIKKWMPRLSAEGVVGADAIFACLGPALEVFSKYSRVEKSNGDIATLSEYLEFVWAAVSTEALALIFDDADASGLEPESRLTAMWLWTIGGMNTEPSNGRDTEESAKCTDGFKLEYDAARKIAQGLGVNLEQCDSLIEIHQDEAILIAVSARTRHLFGSQSTTASRRRRARIKQRTLFDELDEAEAAEQGWTGLKGPIPGRTTLDRVHQAMILFAANRSELLKRFLVEDGVGKDPRFWKLADNLNKLYPAGTEERRWVEGVLARKKGLSL